MPSRAKDCSTFWMPCLTLCVEALVGEVGGYHMVKLEDQGVITDDGFETMSVYPWDPRLFPW